MPNQFVFLYFFSIFSPASSTSICSSSNNFMILAKLAEKIGTKWLDYALEIVLESFSQSKWWFKITVWMMKAVAPG
jgi:hypothetical protein